MTTQTMTSPATLLDVLGVVSADMARELAVQQKVCVRPIVRRVVDQQTGDESKVAIPCGATREAVCPSCADKARRLRIQQCAEGWHRTQEPELATEDQADDGDSPGEDQDTDQDHEDSDDHGRRVRSTRRRRDAPDLPRVPAEDRTVGRVFSTPDGREYRPSMFLTFTLPSYGKIRNGVPVDPATYDYRRAALDALHFPKLVDRLWQNLRRCAGYRVQYFATIEPQKRLAPHLHVAMRGVIPRETIRRVVAATYAQLWWPSFDRAVYVDELPVWGGTDYTDPHTGEVLPTWDEALDQAEQDRELRGRPAHVLRFGSQLDMQGIIAPSEAADRAIRYLTKYLAKSISTTYTPDQADQLNQDQADSDNGNHDHRGVPAYQAHVDRLHAELRWLPCSEQCPNWLRYGIQPQDAEPGMQPGWCDRKAHDRDHLGLGGRRVLVSRQWSGKTLKQHKADRATVVREALLSSGILAPEVERMAATVTLPDGRPRYVWTDTKTDPATYARVILESVAERIRWHTQYDQAKGLLTTRSATAPDPDG